MKLDIAITREIEALRRSVLDDRFTREFVDQFAPSGLRRRLEFESRLITLVESHCAAREESVRAEAERVTAKALGSKGGELGGIRRRDSLSPEQRQEIARRAARARWHGRRDGLNDAVTMINSFRANRGKYPSRRAVAKYFKVSTSTATRYLKAAVAARELR